MKTFLVFISKRNFSIAILILIILNIRHTSAYVDNYINAKYLYKRQASCSDTQFTCTDGKCINSDLVCDGNGDCEDGSDETIQRCEYIQCPRYAFQCSYGACIDTKLKCDGRKNCIDGSDESDIYCSDPKNKNQCSSSEFACKSGQCISSFAICDGITDCNDSSDETFENCRNMPCPKFSFRCDYGACIEAKYRCDKTVHCVDGSDESPKLCRTTSHVQFTTTDKTTLSTSLATTSTNVKPFDSCQLPVISPDKRYQVRCKEKGGWCNDKPGTSVSMYTELIFHCNEGYMLEGNNNNTFETICVRGKWITPIHTCSKVCKKLSNHQTIDLKCYRKNEYINCNDVLLAGTKVKPQCKIQYYPLNPLDEITCMEDGEWDKPLYKCDPVCGVSNTKITKCTTTLISLGNDTKCGDSPWHVAIYDKRYADGLICSGTIITEKLIVSAAHCFYLNETRQDYKFYDIVVSKYTRSYSTVDNAFQQTYQIRDLRFSKFGYYGRTNGYDNDIVIIILSSRVSFNQYVIPVCIHWSDYKNYEHVDGTIGKVVGWGYTETGRLSQKLQTAELPFISKENCIKKSPDILGQYLRNDKFCSGTEQGAGVRQGDSGGGLVFRDEYTNRYYLRGIVSAGVPDNISIALFTDVHYHMEDLILRVREEIDREIPKLK